MSSHTISPFVIVSDVTDKTAQELDQKVECSCHLMIGFSGSTAFTKPCCNGYESYCKVTFYASIKCHFVSVSADQMSVFYIKLQGR